MTQHDVICLIIGLVFGSLFGWFLSCWLVGTMERNTVRDDAVRRKFAFFKLNEKLGMLSLNGRATNE